jgi:hypothetical protein
MQSIVQNDLNWDWLHDAVVREFLFQTHDDERVLKIFLNCPKDCGYAPWQGKKLVLSFHDISAMNQMVWGVRGKETIDSIQTQNSASFREKTIVARRTGEGSKNFEVKITFHSGSLLEILCEDLKADVVTP